MPSEDHLTPFLEAMHEGDLARASEHLSETVELNSPILPTPFKGRASVSTVLGELLSTIDAFEPKMMMRDGADVIAVLTIRFEDHVIDACDHVRLGEDGRIETMTIAWRPLAAVVAIQQRLVPKLGGKAMRLVPIDH
ncbi:nuclear transport factor 2 family protein [Agrobacterium vitis]|jgi:limonene-1,2-epoxide hydrolase